MPRKVFISVLGSSPYIPVKYYHEKVKTGNEPLLHFVQEANIRKYCLNWSENDYAYFFVTNGPKGSKKCNWNHPAHLNNTDVNPKYDGLSNRLTNLDIEFKYEAVDILDGNSEEELWDIFLTVFNRLKEKDEIFFDATHAFRSIPLLVMVLTNYAKFLKKVKVEKILYGAFEKLGRPRDVAAMPEKERYVPVLDLTSLSELQEWTKAASDFEDFGNVDRLAELTKQRSDFLKRINNTDEQSYVLKGLSDQLPKFVKNIQTCRGQNINKNKSGYEINKTLNSLKGKVFEPLAPILEKLKYNISQFEEKNNIQLGFHAVQWCIRNGLIQQGITLMQETIVSMVCEECNLSNDSKEHREAAHAAFAVWHLKNKESKWKANARKHIDLVKNIHQKTKIIGKVSKQFKSLRDLRNDINHGGYLYDANPNPAEFKDRLDKEYKSIEKKLMQNAY